MAKKGYTSKDDFLQMLKIEEEDFEIGGRTVRIRPLSMTEAQEVRLANMKDGQLDVPGMMADVIVLGLVEPKLSKEDVEALREGKAGMIDRLSERLTTISGLGDEFEKKAGGGS